MLLRCFGEIRLEDSSFKQKTPLLLLAYCALKEVKLRSELRDVFWPYQYEEELQQKNLSEALRRLRGIDKSIIQNDTKDTLLVKIDTDVEAFLSAYEAGAYEKVVSLYEGPFLEGVERETKLNLGIELEEWILSEREKLHDYFLEAQLRLALSKARVSLFDEAARLAWKVFLQCEGISYPTPHDFKRIVLLLSAAAETKKIMKVVAEAVKLYEGIQLKYSAAEAKERLAGLFGLPAKNNLFVGRDKEITALGSLLQFSSKQVTLLGLGGVGKTELGVALGHAVKDDFVDGVYYLKLGNDFWDSLERLMDTDERASIEGLRQFFRDKACLFILDNAEANTALAKRVAVALSDCPDLRLLVTSRETLGIPSEHLFFLKGLDYPEAEAELKNSPAVDLFVSHAVRYGVSITNEQLGDVLRICKLVQGHPLSLVLASTWTHRLSVKAIADALEESLFGLSPESENLLRETIDRSIKTLSADLNQTLLALTLFPEPFDLSEVQNVTNVTMFDVKHLVDASLLNYDAKTNTYNFHPVIKAYCQSKLNKEENLKLKTHSSFAEHYLTKLQTSNLNDAEDIKALLSQKEALMSAWHYAISLNKQDLIMTSLNSLLILFSSQGWQEDALDLISKTDLAEENKQIIKTRLKLELGLFTEATELIINTNEAEGLILLALAYSFENHFEAADKALEKAKGMNVNAKQIDFLMSQAILNIRKGQLEEGLSQLESLKNTTNIHVSLACHYFLARAYALKKAFSKANASLEIALSKAEHYHLPYWQAKLTLLIAKQQYYQDDWLALKESIRKTNNLSLNRFDSIDRTLLEVALEIKDGNLRSAQDNLKYLLSQCLNADQKIHLLFLELQHHIITQDPKESLLSNFLIKQQMSAETSLLKQPTPKEDDGSWQHLDTDDVLWFYKSSPKDKPVNT